MQVCQRQWTESGPRRSALRRGAPTGPGRQPPHDPRSSRRPSLAAGTTAPSEDCTLSGPRRRCTQYRVGLDTGMRCPLLLNRVPDCALLAHSAPRTCASAAASAVSVSAEAAAARTPPPPGTA
eukprot:235998-Prorocentrum_minimum.AAC.1